MRKVFLFAAAALFGMGVQAATYGILVNGSTFYEAAALSEKDYQKRDQFKASVSMNQGDVFCIYDETNDAKFTIAMEEGEGSAKGSFTEGAESATCNTAGCYDFYIKLKWEDNSMWVCNGAECNATGREINPGQGGGGGGDNPGGGTGEMDHMWYYKGYIDGKDVEPGDATLFHNGTAEFACSEKSYLMILYQVHGVPGVQYMTESYVEGVTHAKLTTTGSEKMAVEPGMYTLYLYDNGDGSVELSTEPLPGKTLVDAEQGGGEDPGEQAIENVYELNLSAPMFDLLGRQVTEEYHGIVIQNGHKFVR